MLDQYLASKMAQRTEVERSRKAEQRRLMADLQAGRATLRTRLFLRSGNLLIGAGQRLKSRYEANLEPRYQPAASEAMPCP